MKSGRLVGVVLASVVILALCTVVAAQAASVRTEQAATPMPSVAVDLPKGWSLIGVPRETDLSTASVGSKLKDSSGYKAWYYWPADNAYYGSNNLYPGYGYWVEASEATRWDLGEPASDVSVDLVKGWNLISVLRETSVDEIDRQVPLKAAGDYKASYYWPADNAYYGSNHLYPGWGYWVETVDRGTVKISAGASTAPAAPVVGTATVPPAPRTGP